jgi:hypothetical protein
MDQGRSAFGAWAEHRHSSKARNALKILTSRHWDTVTNMNKLKDVDRCRCGCKRQKVHVSICFQTWNDICFNRLMLLFVRSCHIHGQGSCRLLTGAIARDWRANAIPVYDIKPALVSFSQRKVIQKSHENCVNIYVWNCFARKNMKNQ